MKLILPIAGDDRNFVKHFKSSKHLIKINGVFLIQKVLNNINIKSFKEIIIICKSKDYKRYNFKKNIKSQYNNIRYVRLNKKTINQIDTIAYADKYLIKDDKIVILNPDSFFDINKNLFKSYLNNMNMDGLIYFINKKEIINEDFNIGKELFIQKNNRLSKILLSNKEIVNNENVLTSAGLYYFKKWEFFIKFLNQYKKLKKQNNHTIILFYNYMLKNNYKINTTSVNNFIDLGNVNKINEYFFWKKYFKVSHKKISKLKFNKIQNIIPAAGEGSRHKKLGFNVPKPLIKISNKEMVLQSYLSLPKSNKTILIFKTNTIKKFNLKKILNKKIKNLNLVGIKNKTKGMAITVSKAKKFIDNKLPVIVSSCDFKCVINFEKLQKMLKTKNPDAIIFTWKNYPLASESPNSHAYVKVKNQIVTKISEKKTISNDPDNDFAVTGMFYFRKASLMNECTKYMIDNKITVNGEYYTATSMNKLLKDKMKIYNFEVDQFISWSLPEHLIKYNLWEKIINKDKF